MDKHQSVACCEEHDIDKIDIYTKDGTCLSDMTQKEIDDYNHEYDEKRKRDNQIGSV